MAAARADATYRASTISHPGAITADRAPGFSIRTLARITRRSSRQARASRSAKVSTRPTWPSAAMARALGDGLIVDSVGQPLDRPGLQLQGHVDDQGLKPPLFVVIDPDPRLNLQPRTKTLSRSQRSGSSAGNGDTDDD